ncbi:MAG TPA: diacylglycerol kinase family protein [Terriglobia bacterium]|nr:diacylglycerol kinase family protein [Terriglobia bacterium]
MRTIILFNPSARRGKARRLLQRALEVFRQRGAAFEVRESQSAEHLVKLARAAGEEKPDLVVSAGGDGTHHYVINGILGSEAPLGLLPMGTGNDLPQGVGLPLDVSAAAAAMVDGRLREIDLARVGKVVYACIGGVGFDSIVTRYANEHAQWLSGRLAYTWSLLRCLSEYRPHPLGIVADGEVYLEQILFSVVGNNVSYGGGIRLAPRARLDDGLLDVCIVPYLHRLELLRWIPRAYHGEHLNHPRIKYFQARRITLDSSSRLELFGDGEFIQELPATIEVEPHALRVVVPAFPHSS